MNSQIQMERFHEACRLNDAGATFLAANDGGKAVKALKSALVLMESISKEESSEDLLMAYEGQGPPRCPSIEIPGLQDTDTFFIYNRAVLLDASSFPSGEIDLAFANAVIMFNLALTFHQRGKTCYQEAKLKRAVYLYDLVVKLVADISVSFGALALAALNNQAQIHNELCNYEQARFALESAQALSEYVPVPCEEDDGDDVNDSSSPFVSAEDLDEIFLNITISQSPTTAPCA